MVEVLPRSRPVELDEAGARRTLRTQVARLERELAGTIADAFSRHMPLAAGTGVAAHTPRGPRLLSLGELEAERDALTAQLSDARRALAEQARRQEESRLLLERMLLAPGRHRFARVAAADVGEGGCGVYRVRPRLGLIGMLMGWWQVKLSSGCPLAGCH
jgi:hypothetical protein